MKDDTSSELLTRHSADCIVDRTSSSFPSCSSSVTMTRRQHAVASAFILFLAGVDGLVHQRPFSSVGRSGCFRRRVSVRRWSGEDTAAADALLDQVARLRAEAAALEEELPESRRQQLQGPAAAAATPRSVSTKADIEAKLRSLPYDAETCRSTLDSCKSESVLGLWDSQLPKFKATNMGQLNRIGIDAASLGIDSDDALEELKNSLGIVVIVSGALAVASLALIGGNLGASLTYLFAVFPVLFLGVGSTNPGLISGAIEIFKTFSDQRYEERRITHEAAHFLIGYMLGIPIAGYNTDAIAPEVVLYDTRKGDRFEIADEASVGAISLTEADVDALSVVALAGAVAECQYFEDGAKGVQGDLAGLNFLMSKCNPRLSPERQQSQTRWAALTAHQLLEDYEPQLQAIMEAFRQKASVPACIAALETAGASK